MDKTLKQALEALKHAVYRYLGLDISTRYTRWQPTTDTTIWTALMDCGGGMRLLPYGCALWRANYGDGSPNTDLCGPTKGEAVCACFVAADPLGHLWRAGV